MRIERGVYMRKKKQIIALLAIAAIVVSFLLGCGFCRRNDMVLADYSVSETGRKLTFEVGTLSSMGYTRGFKDKGGGVKPHYLVFYSTFGGFNSSLGARHAFELDIDEDDTEIYFNRADGGYELVLQKNGNTGEWERP
jgi:hypothetical protein